MGIGEILFFPIEFVWTCICSVFWMAAAAVIVLIGLIAAPFFLLTGRRKSYSKFCSSIADWYWGGMVRFVEFWGRWDVFISGDKIPEKEIALVISNHRWSIDWLMIFLLAVRKGRMGTCKFFAKNSVRYIPGFGWGVWLLDAVFLDRNWAKDFPNIQRTFNTLKQRNLPFWLISHLEGTRISKKKLEESQNWAKKNDLPVLNHTLLPRTKGFVATVEGLRGTVPVVYDVTLVYNYGRQEPTFTSLAWRRGGSIHIHARRYELKDLPTDPDQLSDWLVQRWKEKDQLIEHLLNTGSFPNVQKEPFRHVPVDFTNVPFPDSPDVE